MTSRKEEGKEPLCKDLKMGWSPESQDSHEWEEGIVSEASKNVKCEKGGGQKNVTVGKIRVGINA